jgi:hypothetical protein
MRLPNDHIDELELAAVPVVELLDRRNCTGGDRSSTASEVHEHGSAAQQAQSHALPVGRLELEVGRLAPGLQPVALRRPPDVGEKVLGPEVLVVLLGQLSLAAHRTARAHGRRVPPALRHAASLEPASAVAGTDLLLTGDFYTLQERSTRSSSTSSRTRRAATGTAAATRSLRSSS